MDSDNDKDGKVMRANHSGGGLPEYKDQVRQLGWSTPGNAMQDSSVPMVSVIAVGNESTAATTGSTGTGRIHQVEAVLFDETVAKYQVMLRRVELGVMLVLLMAVAALVPMLVVTLNKQKRLPSSKTNTTSGREPPKIHELHQETKLFANDTTAQDRFGFSVAVDGDLMVVGALYADSAYIFRHNRGVWSQEAKLTGTGRFGRSVAIVSNSTVVVSAYYDDHVGLYGGKAFVFERTGTDWSERARLIASDATPDSLFGFALAVDESTIVVAAQNAGNRTGSAYVFTKTTNGDWIEWQKLTASDAAPGKYFGTSLALHGNALVVGAKAGDGVDEQNSGAAYIFERSSTSLRWSETQKVTGSDTIRHDGFGTSVAIENDTIAVGSTMNDDDGSSSGNVYVFERNNELLWTEQQKIVKPNPDQGTRFGSSMVLKKGILLIAARNGSDDDNDDSDEDRDGEVFVFVRQGSTYEARFQLIAHGLGSLDKEMNRPNVAFDGVIIAVGAANSDTSKGERSGIVYTFRM
jgi:hypothetical protein